MSLPWCATVQHIQARLNESIFWGVDQSDSTLFHDPILIKLSYYNIILLTIIYNLAKLSDW